MRQPPTKKSRATERGELMRYFQKELNRARARDGLPILSMPRMGKIFELIPTKDLYYLKSVCDDAASRGGEFSKRFWWELKPKQEKASKLLPTGQAGSTKKSK